MYNILIVEDELLLRQGIAHLGDWESEGFRIAGEAGNGRQALDLAAQLRPDAVITDIVMPVMNGIDFIRALRAIDPAIPIVILSNYDDFEYVRQALQAGASDYVLKSEVSFVQLLQTLRKAMHIGRPDAPKGKAVSPAPGRLSGEEAVSELYRRGGYRVGVPVRLAVVGVRSFPNESLPEGLPWDWLTGVTLNRGCWLPRTDHLLLLTDAQVAMPCIERLQNYGLQWRLDVCALLGGERADPDGLCADYREALAQRGRWFYEEERPVLPLLPGFAWADFSERAKIMADASFRIPSQPDVEPVRRCFEQLTAVPQRPDPVQLCGCCEELIHRALLCRYDGLPDMEATRGMLLALRAAGNVHRAGELLEIVTKFFHSLTDEDERRDGKENSLTEDIVAYINRHFTEALTLRQIADALHLNYCYASRLFSERHGVGVMEYITGLRMAEACRLLRNGEETVGEIAAHIGYQDSGYFSRVFKKHIGSSPSEYREKNGM